MKLYAPHSMEIFTVGLKNQYRDLLGMFFSDNLQPTALEFYFFFKDSILLRLLNHMEFHPHPLRLLVP